MIYWFTSNGFRCGSSNETPDGRRCFGEGKGRVSRQSLVSGRSSSSRGLAARQPLARDARRTRRRPVRSTRRAFRESSGHDETGRGSTRARDATRGSTTADEPRTHLILRELVQLVHLPLVVIPHGPGRARARTASRGRGSFCQVPEFRAAKSRPTSFRILPLDFLGARLFAFARLPDGVPALRF